MSRILEIKLTPGERKQINGLIDWAVNEFQYEDENSFYSSVRSISYDLPKRLKLIFHEFKHLENYNAIIVRNNLAEEILETPQDYREFHHVNFYKSDVLQALYAGLVGDVFSFRFQRDGHMYNSIIPLKKFEKIKKHSSGSKYDFDFHTEDAFHQFRPDYLSLYCHRNDEKVPTTISCIETANLNSKYASLLFEPLYFIEGNAQHEVSADFYTKQPILFGDIRSPYIKVNLNALNISNYQKNTQDALKYLISMLKQNSTDVMLETGDCIFIDNLRTVHRRRKFIPIYGSNARWLTRVIVTNDLRKSVDYRVSSQSKIIELTPILKHL